MFHSGLSLISFRNHSRIGISFKILTFNYILFHSEITVVIFNAVSSGFDGYERLKFPGTTSAFHEVFYGQSLRQVTSASLHYTSGLHFVPPPYVPFRSLSAPSLGYPSKSASFIPLRSGQPAVSFLSPLAFPPHIPELKAKTGSCIPPTPIRNIAFSHHPWFSPCQPAECPAKCSPQNYKKPQKPQRLLMLQVKIKDHSRIAFVLALNASSCYCNENNCPSTSRCQLFPNSTAHHHHTRNLTFPHRKPKRICCVGNKQEKRESVQLHLMEMRWRLSEVKHLSYMQIVCK